MILSQILPLTALRRSRLRLSLTHGRHIYRWCANASRLQVPLLYVLRDVRELSAIIYVKNQTQINSYQFSCIFKSLAWVISIILGTVTTFSVTLFYQEWYQYNRIEAAAYISLHKLAWGIANGWLIIACSTGNGGIIGKLLTWKFLAPISRLTFCAYLVNGVVELYYVGQLRHPVHITFFTVVAAAVSHIILTFFLALLLCVTFESPLHGIEKILLKMFAHPKRRDDVKREESEGGSRNTSQTKIES